MTHRRVSRRPATRRSFLQAGAALAAAPLLGNGVAQAAPREVAFAGNPFRLGVASGEPASDGFVIWTRLAPVPLEGGGMPAVNVQVTWQLAADEDMRHVVRRGVAVATPQLAHSVHVELHGLQPDRWYWYQFQAGREVSPIGRARTTPADHVLPKKLRFAFASCQHFEQRYFTAFEHMAREDLDLVVHLGDYVYENSGQEKTVRKHAGGETVSLADYRNRYAQYRFDPLLQDGMLAENPWVKFHNGERGYVRCTVTPDEWKSDYQVVENVTRPGAPLITRQSFVIENGEPGVKPA